MIYTIATTYNIMTVIIGNILNIFLKLIIGINLMSGVTVLSVMILLLLMGYCRGSNLQILLMGVVAGVIIFRH